MAPGQGSHCLIECPGLSILLVLFIHLSGSFKVLVVIISELSNWFRRFDFKKTIIVFYVLAGCC